MKLIFFVFLSITIILSCTTKKSNFKFEGEWQSKKVKKQVYKISKINEKTYTLKWDGWIDETQYDGGFPIPGELHTSGNQTLVYDNENLIIMGIPKVSKISENEAIINGENCIRK